MGDSRARSAFTAVMAERCASEVDVDVGVAEDLAVDFVADLEGEDEEDALGLWICGLLLAVMVVVVVRGVSVSVGEGVRC